MTLQTAFKPHNLKEMETLSTDLQYKICPVNKNKMYNYRLQDKTENHF